MLLSILLAKLLVMLYVNYSVIVAGDDSDSNPRQLVLSLPQGQIDIPDPDCVVIIVSALPRTRSGILSLFSEDVAVTREICEFVALSKRIRDDYFQYLADKQKEIENTCREFLRLKFNWGTLTPYNMKSQAALDASKNNYTYLAIVLEMQHLIKTDENRAKSLLVAADLADFQLRLNEVIDTCNVSLREIEEMKLGPESRLASVLPVSPIGSRGVTDYFF